MKKLTIFFIFLMSGFILMAQAPIAGSAKIVGTVYDKSNGAPIEFAQVVVYKTIDSSLVTGNVTDIEGKFVIEKIPFGNFYIVVESIGYLPFIKNEVRLDAENNLFSMNNIQLGINTTELGEVNVVGQTTSMSIKTDKKVLNVDKNLSASGGTAIDALKISPSITLNQDGNVLLRGSTNFKVLINGKPTALSSNDALKQMPAGKIEKLEIITNPSAKFDAAGSAGIINIITKKGMGSGFSAMVNASGGTGNKYNADANVCFSNDKITIVAGLKWKDNIQFYNMDEILDATSDIGKRHNDVLFYREQTDRNFGTNFTIDYALNPKNNFSFSVDGGYTNFYVDANFKYDETIDNQSDHSYVYEDLHGNLKANYYSNNLSFTHRFSENTEWSNSVFYSFIDYEFNNHQDRYSTLADFATDGITPYYTMKFENANFSSEIKAKSDLSSNLKNGAKFESGIQYNEYHRYLDLLAENFNYTSSNWETDPIFTNEFDFNEQIYSAYANYSGEKNGFSYNAGIRLELTDRLIESFTLNEKYAYNKLNIFPTFSVSKEIGKNNTLALNYSRRIDRPDEYFLNPFPDISNEFQEAYGNPLLRPNITDSYELSFQKTFEKGLFSTQLYLKNTNDAYTQVISANNNGVIILTFDNISADKEFGVENMVNLQAAKWWSVNASLNVLGQNSKGIMNDEQYDRSAFTFNTRLINTFTIAKNTSIQLMAFYFHDQLSNSIGNVSKFYWADVAVSQNFFDGKLSATLQAKDIFNTNQVKFDINRADYRFFVHQKPEYPVITFSISYKFNNFKGTKNSVKTKLKI